MNTPSLPHMQSYRHMSETSHLPPRQHDNHQSRQYSPEAMGSNSEQHQHLINPNREYAIDPSLRDPAAATRAMSVDHTYSAHQGEMRPLMDHQYSFEAKESQLPVNFNDEQTQDDAGVDETKKKKGSASSIANDQELRKLFRENHHRDLKEVAAEVLVHERGPRSEKTKQIFAMNW